MKTAIILTLVVLGLVALMFLIVPQLLVMM